MMIVNTVKTCENCDNGQNTNVISCFYLVQYNIRLSGCFPFRFSLQPYWTNHWHSVCVFGSKIWSTLRSPRVNGLVGGKIHGNKLRRTTTEIFHWDFPWDSSMIFPWNRLKNPGIFWRKSREIRGFPVFSHGFPHGSVEVPFSSPLDRDSASRSRSHMVSMLVPFRMSSSCGIANYGLCGYSSNNKYVHEHLYIYIHIICIDIYIYTKFYTGSCCKL